jgi:hypothetical protein
MELYTTLCTCKFCGTKYVKQSTWANRTIKHDFSYIKGTCTLKCNRCGEETEGRHKFVKGICNTCGKECKHEKWDTYTYGTYCLACGKHKGSDKYSLGLDMLQ